MTGIPNKIIVQDLLIPGEGKATKVIPRHKGEWEGWKSVSIEQGVQQSFPFEIQESSSDDVFRE